MTDDNEALVERVANALQYAYETMTPPASWVAEARAIIAGPPKPLTDLEIARELLAVEHRRMGCEEVAQAVVYGGFDSTAEMRAIMAALRMDKLEDGQ